MKKVQLKTKDDAIDFIETNYPYAWDLFHNWYLTRCANNENLPIQFLENEEEDVLDLQEEYETFSTYSILDFETDVFIGVVLRFISEKAYMYPDIIDMYNRDYSFLSPNYTANSLQFVINAFLMIESGNLKQLN